MPPPSLFIQNAIDRSGRKVCGRTISEEAPWMQANIQSCIYSMYIDGGNTITLQTICQTFNCTFMMYYIPVPGIHTNFSN
jgi:hypothetical protein